MTVTARSINDIYNGSLSIRTIHSSRRNRIMEPPDVGEKHHILCIEMLSKECQHGRQ